MLRLVDCTVSDGEVLAVVVGESPAAKPSDSFVLPFAVCQRYFVIQGCNGKVICAQNFLLSRTDPKNQRHVSYNHFNRIASELRGHPVHVLSTYFAFPRLHLTHSNTHSSWIRLQSTTDNWDRLAARGKFPWSRVGHFLSLSIFMQLRSTKAVNSISLAIRFLSPSGFVVPTWRFESKGTFYGQPADFCSWLLTSAWLEWACKKLAFEIWCQEEAADGGWLLASLEWVPVEKRSSHLRLSVNSNEIWGGFRSDTRQRKHSNMNWNGISSKG